MSSTDQPDDGTRTVADLLTTSRIAMLTTRAPDGVLMSRPMAVQEVEFDGDLWFFADAASRKVAHVTADPQVNVTVGSGSTWVSLTGIARVVREPARKRELWNSAVEAWFPDGPDADHVVLLQVDGLSAEDLEAALARGRALSLAEACRRVVDLAATTARRTTART